MHRIASCSESLPASIPRWSKTWSGSMRSTCTAIRALGHDRASHQQCFRYNIVPGHAQARKLRQNRPRPLACRVVSPCRRCCVTPLLYRMRCRPCFAFLCRCCDRYFPVFLVIYVLQYFLVPVIIKCVWHATQQGQAQRDQGFTLPATSLPPYQYYCSRQLNNPLQKCIVSPWQKPPQGLSLSRKE